MTKKVLFTASTRSHIVNFHLPYIRAFEARGWQVDVACGVSAEEISGAARVFLLPFEKKMRSPKNFAAAALLRRRIREEKYDLICAHTALGGFFTRLAVLGLRKRPKLCFMAHGYLFDENTPFLRGLLLQTAEKLAAPVTDLLITMNAWDDAWAKRHRLGKRIRCIPGIGVDFSRLDGAGPDEGKSLRRELGLGDGDFVILYMAEFSRRKDQAVLIRAMEMLPERARLLLPGDGRTREECIALASELGLGGRVLFPGYVQNVRPYFLAADAAASSSRTEGLPFNIIEAMHCGLPVAATAVKGHTDLVADGETGLLFPRGDSAACAACLNRLMEEPAFSAALGEAAGAAAEKYRLESVLPQVMACYDEIANM